MSDLVNELRALCVSECRNRLDYRCAVCCGADAVEQLAAAQAASVKKDMEIVSLRAKLRKKQQHDNL